MKNLRPRRNIKTAMNHGDAARRTHLCTRPPLHTFCPGTPGLSLRMAKYTHAEKRMVWDFGMDHQGGKTPWANLVSVFNAEFNATRSKDALTQCFKALLKEKDMTALYRETKAKMVKERRHQVGVERAADWQTANPEAARKKAKRSRNKYKDDEDHKTKRRAKNKRNQPRANARDKERKREDPAYHLIRKARCRLSDYLKKQNIKKQEKTMSLIDCTRSELLQHVQRQLDGRVLSECHTDHIFPFRFYKLPQQLNMVSNWSNLQPLTPSENDSKLDKLPTKAMAAKVDRSCWPDGVTEDMLPDIYPGWATPLRM